MGISIETGRRGVTEFFDEPLRGFVCERAAVQSAEFVLIQHMVKIARGILGVSQVYGNVTCIINRYKIHEYTSTWHMLSHIHPYTYT